MARKPTQPITVRFNVHQERPLSRGNFGYRPVMRVDTRDFDSVESAERSARQLCRIHACPVTIDRVESGRNRYKADRVAVVRLDAYGRVWTDLEGIGPALL